MAAKLEALLQSYGRQELCGSVIPALLDCISDIARTLRRSQHVSLIGTANAFGDQQLNVDESAEGLIRAALARCPSIFTASSEEDPVEKAASNRSEGGSLTPRSEQYTVAFDPLDGSSIIDSNWTVGTIIGIWDGRSALHQEPSSKQIAAIVGVYGPRTTVILALRLPGVEASCLEIGLGEDGFRGSEIIRSIVRFAPPPFRTRYFAPANLRAAAESPAYMRLVARYIGEKYTLRYSGGLVPDLVHALVKGHGVYISPVTGASKAKLRRLYELYPIALIVECAGGKAVDPADGRSILDRALESCDERAGLICGTAEEVDAALKALLGFPES
jgi:sedoheptulose-bisphosphatase